MKRIKRPTPWAVPAVIYDPATGEIQWSGVIHVFKHLAEDDRRRQGRKVRAYLRRLERRVGARLVVGNALADQVGLPRQWQSHVPRAELPSPVSGCLQSQVKNRGYASYVRATQKAERLYGPLLFGQQIDPATGLRVRELKYREGGETTLLDGCSEKHTHLGSQKEDE